MTFAIRGLRPVAILVVVIVAACGANPSTERAASPTRSSSSGPASAVASGVANDATCDAVALDPFFEGEAAVFGGFSSGGLTTCSMNFRGDSPVLRKLGIRSECPFPEASIAIAVTLDEATRRWKYDGAGTAGVDNGECVEG
jgi:hypothetical protein